MAQRRLFSPKIVDSDAFLDMPISTQAFYFHLGMEADDDGFVSPRKVMRKIGATEDDLKVLISKRFVLVFQNGVIVIKHWLIHNTIRKDRYTETKYIEEKKSLYIKENGSYTDVLPLGNQMATIRQPNVIPKLSKVKLSKDKIRETETKNSLAYLDSIPREDIDNLMGISSASEDNILAKANDLKDYCAAHGKRYKDYQAFLRNAVKKDYPPKSQMIKNSITIRA